MLEGSELEEVGLGLVAEGDEVCVADGEVRG